MPRRLLKKSSPGLRPWFGLCPKLLRAKPKPWAYPRSEVIQLTAGHSPASHPAAKPQLCGSKMTFPAKLLQHVFLPLSSKRGGELAREDEAQSAAQGGLFAQGRGKD